MPDEAIDKPPLTKNLRQLVERRGGVRAVAVTLKVSPSTVSRWCRGLQHPGQESILALAALAGVEPAVFHYGALP